MPLAIGAIVLLSIVNYFGVKPGSRVLNVLVVLKVAALVVLIVAGAMAPADQAGGAPAGRQQRLASARSLSFGAALIPILFAYGGWQNANYVAEEIENPRRNLPLSLLAGTVAVVVIYVLVNAVYLRALGLEGLASTTTPASKAAEGMFGALGDRFVTAAIAISTFGFLDLAILAPTRVYYAMAADRLFFPGARAAASALQDTVAGDPDPVHLVVRAGSDRTLRAAAQLCRLRGLDFLWPDGRHGDRLSTDGSARPEARRRLPRAGLPVRTDTLRPSSPPPSF